MIFMSDISSSNFFPRKEVMQSSQKQTYIYFKWLELFCYHLQSAIKGTFQKMSLS